MKEWTIDVAEPISLILLLTIVVLLIFLGKELKKPYIPAIGLIGFLLITIMHSVQLAIIPQGEELHKIVMGSIFWDLVFVFLLFISYLWVDDIACKAYQKKSLDNSLDWFWNKF